MLSSSKCEKGLCFYSDEKYSFSHKCKASVHVLITPDVEEGGEDDCIWEDSDEVLQVDHEVVAMGETTPHISFYAMSGVFLPQTLKFRGSIGKIDISVLVDGSSTHNFIQSRVVSVLNLPITFNKQFEVMVGNVEILHCEGLCTAVPIRIQKKIFFVDFYILPIQGTDVVLGVQWLQLLGPIRLDYQMLTMEFSWQDEKVHLQGEQHGSQQIFLNQLRRLQTKKGVASMFQITLLPGDVPAPTVEVNEEVEQLLKDFEELFTEPKTLPPQRMLDHEIHLLPNSVPVNVRPYRYPHFQTK